MPSISCTKLPPKRVLTSNERCSSRITVSPSRACSAAGRRHPRPAEVLRDGDGHRPARLHVGGAEAAARGEQAEDEDGGAPHRTVNTTRVVPRCQRRAVAGAVDRDRVEHVAALARARAGSRYDQSARSPIAKYAPRPHRVPRKRSMRPEKYQHFLPRRLVSRSLTVLMPDGSAPKLPRSSRGPRREHLLVAQAGERRRSGAVRSGASDGRAGARGRAPRRARSTVDRRASAERTSRPASARRPAVPGGRRRRDRSPCPGGAGR